MPNATSTTPWCATEVGVVNATEFGVGHERGAIASTLGKARAISYVADCQASMHQRTFLRWSASSSVRHVGMRRLYGPPIAYTTNRCASTASDAADTLIRAWYSGESIASAADYPPAPESVEELYAVHDALIAHPLANKPPLNGIAGYKVGAVGAEGEVCIYAPLFSGFVVRAPGSSLSATRIQMHQIEPELVITLATDLPAREDGMLHTPENLWSDGSIGSVLLCIECCGARAASGVMASQSTLGRFQDSLAAGGLVIGSELQLQTHVRAINPRFRGTVLTDAAPGSSTDSNSSCTGVSLADCETTLKVNGQTVAKGSTARCPAGGPLEAVAWLANHLNSRGLMLRNGHVVATGQTCMTRDFGVGDSVEAEFGGLGSVEMIVAP